MLRMRKLMAAMNLDRMWFVHNTKLSYECIRDLDEMKRRDFKTSTLEEIYRGTKEKFGSGFLPGDYLDGEMWEHCRSGYSELIDKSEENAATAATQLIQ